MIRASRPRRLFAPLLGIILGLPLLRGTGFPADAVQFAMDWIISGSNAPFVAGVDRGFYRQRGIECEIVRGFGSADTVKKVAAGLTPFGFADIGALIEARSKGAKAKALAVIYDKSMYVLYVLEDSGIRRIKDLEGKTIATVAGNIVTTLFPPLAAANQTDASKVKWEVMAAPLLTPSLLAGKVDAMTAFATRGPVAKEAAAKAGKKVVGIYYSDYGVDLYSNGILSNDDGIAQRPDLVGRFTRATLEALAWTVEHPAEAVEALVKYHPTLDRRTARGSLDVLMEHLLTPTAYEKGLGYIREDKMRYSRDLITKYLKVEWEVPIEELYTMAFLPKILPKKR